MQTVISFPLRNLFMLFFLLCSVNAYAGKLAKSETARNEQIVVNFYTKIFIQGKNIARVSKRFLTEDYIQHNPYTATGRQAFIDGVGGWLASLPETRRVEIKRVVSSGDMVVLHVHAYDTSNDHPGSAGVDIFRVNTEGKIVEHWDVWQDIPEWMPHDNGMF